MKEYFKIGKLAASTGLKGELVLKHSLGKATNLKEVTAIFLENPKDVFIPYFIIGSSVRSETETILKLENIDVVEVARKLTPKEVWLQEADFKKYAEKTSPISLLGFEMWNEEDLVGIITEVIEQPHQILCSIQYKGKEALIPVHENNLLEMDHKNKKIIVEIPEGLLEIYE